MSRNDKYSTKVSKKRTIALSYLHIIPPATLAFPQERGYVECPCTKNCILHGECKLCVAYHARKGKLPRCER